MGGYQKSDLYMLGSGTTYHEMDRYQPDEWTHLHMPSLCCVG